MKDYACEAYHPRCVNVHDRVNKICQYMDAKYFIMFNMQDATDDYFSYLNALVIKVMIENYIVHIYLVNEGSSVKFSIRMRS